MNEKKERLANQPVDRVDENSTYGTALRKQDIEGDPAQLGRDEPTARSDRRGTARDEGGSTGTEDYSRGLGAGLPRYGRFRASASSSSIFRSSVRWSYLFSRLASASSRSRISLLPEV